MNVWHKHLPLIGYLFQVGMGISFVNFLRSGTSRLLVGFVDSPDNIVKFSSTIWSRGFQILYMSQTFKWAVNYSLYLACTSTSQRYLIHQSFVSRKQGAIIILRIFANLLSFPKELRQTTKACSSPRMSSCLDTIRWVSWSAQAALSKVPQTGWLIHSGNLFLMVLEPGCPGSEGQHDGVLVRAFPGLLKASLCLQMVEREPETSLRSLSWGH